jgi:hypothetical protein
VACQNCPSSTVSVFDFSYVDFAAIPGYLMSAGIPAPMVSLGIPLIVSSGIIASRQHPA